MIIISKKEFVLREYREQDKAFVIRLLSESLAMTFFPPEKIAEHAQLWLEDQWHSYGTHGFGIWLLESLTGEVLGQCGLMMRNIEDRQRIELGFSILRAHRGRGLATGAARAVIAWAGQKGMDQPVAVIAPDNDPARRVLEHCGFRFQKEFERFGQKALLFHHHVSE